MQTPSVCVGIDVSKARLDVAVRPSGEPLSVAYDANGITTVIVVKERGENKKLAVGYLGSTKDLVIQVTRIDNIKEQRQLPQVS